MRSLQRVKLFSTNQRSLPRSLSHRASEALVDLTASEVRARTSHPVCKRKSVADRMRIIKAAGLSFFGFCAVSAMADKFIGVTNLSQIAGFCGAFTGALVGRYKIKDKISGSAEESLTVLPLVSAPPEKSS